MVTGASSSAAMALASANRSPVGRPPNVCGPAVRRRSPSARSDRSSAGQLGPRRAPGQHEQGHARLPRPRPPAARPRAATGDRTHQTGRLLPSPRDAQQSQLSHSGLDAGRPRAPARAVATPASSNGIVDGDPADVTDLLRARRGTSSKQRRAEIVEHPPKAGPGTRVRPIHGVIVRAVARRPTAPTTFRAAGHGHVSARPRSMRSPQR